MRTVIGSYICYICFSSIAEATEATDFVEIMVTFLLGVGIILAIAQDILDIINKTKEKK